MRDVHTLGKGGGHTLRCVINIDHIRFSIKEPRGARPDLQPRAARVASARKLIQTSNGDHDHVTDDREEGSCDSEG